MGWFGFLFLSVLALAACLVVVRNYLLPWRQLEKMVNDLAEGKRPGSFVFHGARRFTRVALSIEKLADEQRRLKQQISEEEFNLQAILSSMVEGVMVVDNNHIIRLVSASFLKLFNLRSSPLQQSVLTALREAALEEILRETARTGETQSREITVLSDSVPPVERHFAVSVVPIKKADGKVTGMMAVFHDISRLRQLEDIRREFVANVSHELRTPLSIFHGYLENLLDNPAMPRRELVAIFEIMEKHSRRLNALLEDLLAIARLESRREKLEFTSIDLPSFLRQFCKDWAPKAAKKKIALTLDAPPGLPPLAADAFRVEQVFNNLLDNAFKYAPEKGSVAIAVRAQNGGIEIRVEDNGIGIPPRDLPHIFERFYRVEKARSRENGGTGLGLSIVKHIMALHGGTVEAQSALGKGTSIILHFPEKAPEKS